MRVFPPCREPHAWRQAFALLSLTVWTMIGVYWLIAGPVTLWLIRQGGAFDWTFGPIQA